MEDRLYLQVDFRCPCGFCLTISSARLQEPIGYVLTARDRLAVGDALKRVSLGYFPAGKHGQHTQARSPRGFPPSKTWAYAWSTISWAGTLIFIVIFVGTCVYSVPVTALIALAAAAASFPYCLVLVISRFSAQSTLPWRPQANRGYDGRGHRILCGGLRPLSPSAKAERLPWIPSQRRSGTASAFI